MPRCNDCNKFVGLETQDPEDCGLEISDGEITGSIRVVRNCADCGSELKEANFEVSQAIPDGILADHDGEGHELTADFDLESTESGGGRYAKNMIGFGGTAVIRCACQDAKEPELCKLDFSDAIPASEFDEL